MKTAKLQIKSGYLEGPDQTETFKKPKIVFGDFFDLDKPLVDTKLSVTRFPETINRDTVVSQIIIASAGNSDYRELFEVLTIFAKQGQFSFFSGYQGVWENETLTFNDGAMFSDSLVAKCIKAEIESGKKIKLKWIFTNWNEFKLQGDLKDGVLETK